MVAEPAKGVRPAPSGGPTVGVVAMIVEGALTIAGPALRVVSGVPSGREVTGSGRCRAAATSSGVGGDWRRRVRGSRSPTFRRR